MNWDDIIRMMREAHLDVYGLGKDREKFVSVVERFAALVAAAEREACAKVCVEQAKVVSNQANGKTVALHCAHHIRARGQE